MSSNNRGFSIGHYNSSFRRKNRHILIDELKTHPFNIIIPPDNRSTEERYQMLKRKGLP
jgi:hypothetical protein